ncbi:UNVERIFIED_ORG: Ca2+-binding RTX toxin-like protein [Rhizobium pisi]
MAVITGTSGDDTLNGTTGDDQISGLDGNDILTGGAGADQLIGGAGTDTASYAMATGAIIFNLKTGVYTGEAAGDTFSSIEVLSGSAYADTFVGNGTTITFDGYAGDDTVDYSASAAAVNVTLAGPGVTTVASGGDAQGNSLVNIEKVIGSAFNDTLGSTSPFSYTLQGGAGNDTYVVGSAVTGIVEAAGGGDDEIRTTATSYSMSSYANVERLTFTGTGNATLTGNTGDNIITGGTGNDILTGGSGADQLIGGAGTDTASYAMATGAIIFNLKTGVYTGEAAGDTFSSIEVLSGSAYADTFVGNGTTITFDGYAGDDTVDYSASAAAVNVTLAGPGVTTVASGGDAQGNSLVNIEKVIGSAFNDTLGSTSPFSYTLQGGAGNDTYVVGSAVTGIVEAAGGGDDEIRTTATSYSMSSYANVERLTFTGTGNATLTGNTGDNIITGGTGNDILTGGDGDDILIGGAGADQLIGGAGTDTASYANAAAAITLNLKTGVHTGDAAGDTFSSIEAFAGSNFNDTLIGGTSDDILIGGAGADQLIGDAGTDTASYANAATAITLNLKTGVHTGDAAGDTFDSIEVFTGSSFDDTFFSSASADTLNGAAGTDTIDYSLSSDAVNVDLTTNVVSGGDAAGDVVINFERVVGSAFADTLASSTSGHALVGGAGNDIYVVGNQGVTITEAAGGGTDEIRTTLTSYSMAAFANVERLIFTGSGNTTLTGNSGNNVIAGGTGNDTLIGGAGADQLVGGAGTDTASYANAGAAITVNLKTGANTGDAAGDTFSGIETFVGSNSKDTFVGNGTAVTFNGGVGTDTVSYSSSAAAINVILGASGVTTIASGGDAEGNRLISIEQVIGSAFADTLGSTATSTQTLQGGGGNDTYVVSSQNTVITESSGAGDDEIRTSATSYSMAAYTNVEHLTFTGTGNATLTGNVGDNVITGGTGNDTLIGGAGADQLIGGAGTDTASYANAAAAVTLDLKTGVHAGDAAGDTFDGIEVFTGSNFDDTFFSSASADHLNGAAGTLDTIDYSLSSDAINVNLTTNVVSGGDAAGDVLANFERVVGSSFADTLASSTSGHALVGGAGDDIYLVDAQGVTITEGAGEGTDEIRTTLTTYSMANDANVEKLTFTGTGNATLTGNAGDNIITGGAGNDTLNGGGGNDQLHGGSGEDTLFSGAGDFHLYGGDGSDTLNLISGQGFADGGNDGDTYHVNMVLSATIKDTGVDGSDAVYLDRVQSLADLDNIRIGNDLVLQSHADATPGTGYENATVILQDWYAGANSIESFYLADGTQVSGTLFS